MSRVTLDNNGIVVPWKPKLGITRPVVNTKASNDLFRIDRVMAGEPITIQVIRSAGGIGDVLMTFPLVKYLKKKYNCKLIYSTDYGYLDGALKKVALHNPFIDEVVDAGHFKESETDIAINLTCPCVAHEVPRAQPVHRIDLFAGFCGIKLTDRQIDYVVTDREKAWALEWYQSKNLNPQDCVVVQPYASNSRRSLDVKKLQRALMEASVANPKLRFIVIRHDSDFDRNSNWDLQKTHQFKNYDVVHVSALIDQCGLVVCPDSAILHVAGALSKKIVAFFGPTDYRARTYNNQISICPAQEFAFWPPWYKEEPPGAAMMCWNAVEPAMISNAIIEHTMNVSIKTSNGIFHSETL